MSFLLPKPKFIWLRNDTEHKIVSKECNELGKQFLDQFDEWFDREIKPLFENAIILERRKSLDGRNQAWFKQEIGTMADMTKDQILETGLLINIQPTKGDTADDILRELMEASELDSSIGSEETNRQLQPVLEKARKYLEKKK